MVLQQSANGFAVKVTSTSFIKPSSPTPSEFRIFKLSLLDQLYPSPLYPTFVLFYPHPPPHLTSTSPQQLLRDSLSETLSHFNPLSGRIRGSTIDCNDRGAQYLEAQANQDMLHFLSSSPAPNTHLLRLLAPPRPKFSPDMPLACVQITIFTCGGIALGICLNHTIADAHTLSLFLNHWAAVARGDSDSEYCSLTHLHARNEAASLFPTNDAVLNSKPLPWRIPTDDLSEIVQKSDAIILQRFVFKSCEISALQSRVKSSEVSHPSRTVAIFGLIWKIATKASTNPTSAALVIVNLRPRFKIPLPDYSVGNIWWTAVLQYDDDSPTRDETMSSQNDELQRLAFRLKKSVEEVDAEFIENLKGETGHEKMNKFLQGRGTGKDYLFTSMVKMGFNDVNFGFGKPVWVSFLGQTDVLIPFGACLLEATGYDGDGNAVEAWVALPEKEMAIFEQDPELLQYADVNPRVNV